MTHAACTLKLATKKSRTKDKRQQLCCCQAACQLLHKQLAQATLNTLFGQQFRKLAA
jgi:hypothetical protein